jgi:uncharacterized damage-inducible protein DinB
MNAEQAKFLTEFFANSMEQDGQTTAKVLAAVPDNNRDYKPDAKSRTAWELATHLAISDVWFIDSIIKGAFEFDPKVEERIASQFTNVNDVVEWYKKTFPEKLQELRALPPEKLTQVVDFFGMFQWPNASYLMFANNHSVHHRGQLAAYLRAAGSKVPSIYGGSADEPMVAAQA